MNNVTLTLDADQIGKSSIVLTAAQLASISAQENAPPVVTPPSTGTVPPFVPPPEVAARALIRTEVKWLKGAGPVYSQAPLTDANAWCMGFTPTDTTMAMFATAEYQGPWVMRNWALVRNVDGVIVAQSSKPIQTPTLLLNGQSSPITHRIPLTVGTRYTFTVWNATPGQSSPMVGQLYL